jgi:hypothetical protein
MLGVRHQTLDSEEVAIGYLVWCETEADNPLTNQIRGPEHVRRRARLYSIAVSLINVHVRLTETELERYPEKFKTSFVEPW